MKVIIIGGVAGGMSAATRLRRLDESAQIVVFERGPEVSYANCGLPYFVGGVIADRDALLVQTAESLHRRFRLQVHTRHDVTAIDTSTKTVSVTDLTTGEVRDEQYDRLVLAPGARPGSTTATSSIPIRTLRTLADAEAIHAALGTPGTPVVVVGGGYTGLEAVENLVARGARVVLVQRGAQILSSLDPEMSAAVADEIGRHGIDLRVGTEIDDIDADGVTLTDGSRIPAAFIVDAAGVVPEVSLAAEAGLRIGSSGGIWVDGTGRTSVPDVYAVGDAVEKRDPDDVAVIVAMAGLANRHGRMVADVIAGRSASARPSLGTGIVSVFGLAAAKVGWTERQLRAMGRAHYVVHVHPGSHAGYYPGAQTLSIKLMADPETDRILGAQVTGRDGVDKRVDVIATAMHAGLGASELAHLELAYAPQFGSAKDAVNIAGYVAENTRTGTTPTIQWHELDDEVAEGSTVIDVRSAAEHSDGGIPGAISIPLDDLRDRLAEVPAGPVIVHCHVGLRGHLATRLLIQRGFSARNLDGGYLTWRSGMSAGRRQSEHT